jgi:hypothetical protein
MSLSSPLFWLHPSAKRYAGRRARRCASRQAGVEPPGEARALHVRGRGRGRLGVPPGPFGRAIRREAMQNATYEGAPSTDDSTTRGDTRRQARRLRQGHGGGAGAARRRRGRGARAGGRARLPGSQGRPAGSVRQGCTSSVPGGGRHDSRARTCGQGQRAVLHPCVVAHSPSHRRAKRARRVPRRFRKRQTQQRPSLRAWRSLPTGQQQPPRSWGRACPAAAAATAVAAARPPPRGRTHPRLPRCRSGTRTLGAARHARRRRCRRRRRCTRAAGSPAPRERAAPAGSCAAAAARGRCRRAPGRRCAARAQPRRRSAPRWRCSRRRRWRRRPRSGCWCCHRGGTRRWCPASAT